MIFNQLAVDLEAVRAGRLDPVGFRLRHPVTCETEEIEHILCNLEHYFADADIRERDQQYRRFHDEELGRLIRLIRAGELAKAELVDFLNVTDP